MREVLAYLGLGTNLGDRWTNLREALRLLPKGTELRVLRCSQVYESEPWGVADQPPFLNCAVEVATTLGPEALLAQCKEIEQRLGRLPGPRWGPRLIDLDILLYGTQVVSLPHLEIPHPRLHLRAFALLPLAELAPTVIHPPLGTSIDDLTRNTDGNDGVMPLGDLRLAVSPSECRRKLQNSREG